MRLITEVELKRLEEGVEVSVKYQSPNGKLIGTAHDSSGLAVLRHLPDVATFTTADGIRLDYAYTGNGLQVVEKRFSNGGTLQVYAFVVSNHNGVQTRHQLTPPGWIDIDVYHPHATPWDCCGNNHLAEYSRVLANAGIECQALTTLRENLSPIGSGPKGHIRFGDSMMPGVYRIAVAEAEEKVARSAFAAHRQAIQSWLWGKGRMPEACRT